MPDKITFTGVQLKSFSRNVKGGKATFHANFTKAVADQMGWGAFQPGQRDVALEGELAASRAVLQPKDGALANWRIEWEATAVKGFEGLRLELEGHKGKRHRFELRFAVEFADKTACRYLEEFITNVGEAKSTLDVSYTKQAALAGDEDDGQLTLDDERKRATAKEAEAD